MIAKRILQALMVAAVVGSSTAAEAEPAATRQKEGSVIAEPPFPHVFSSGHGVWRRRGAHTFSQTALQLISDLKGQLVFVNTIRRTVTLNESKDRYRSVWIAEFTDPAGNVVMVFNGASEGQRIKVEPLP